ncbi:MAG: hemerythrin domain-containing protein [Phycisphaerae bacterium]|nr:hemerythrin domain-containing protein [Phycisphaerae bacterium]
MAAVDLARSMREEHDRVDELANSVRQITAVIHWANFQSWLGELRQRFEHLRAHLVQHMALEERDGYFLPVLERRPGLAPQVEALRKEHEEMMRILDNVHQAVLALQATDRLLVRDCCIRINALLGFLEHHESAENILISTVFTHDIGTKD